jgi:putative endonuclease
MAKHNEIGAKGEEIAKLFFSNLGYSILETNWRVGHKEVDLIMVDGAWLVFCEVKTRTGKGFGFPEEAITLTKQQHLQLAAQYYIEEKSTTATVRFDVLSIVLAPNGDILEQRHIKDAF